MRARASDRESPLHGEYSEVRSWFSSFALGSGDQAQVVRLVIQATSVATYNAVLSPFSREGSPDVKEHVLCTGFKPSAGTRGSNNVLLSSRLPTASSHPEYIPDHSTGVSSKWPQVKGT